MKGRIFYASFHFSPNNKLTFAFNRPIASTPADNKHTHYFNQYIQTKTYQEKATFLL